MVAIHMRPLCVLTIFRISLLMMYGAQNETYIED